MPYKTFQNWLFDGNLRSPIPSVKYDNNGKEIVPDLLSYKSPITCTYVITIFLNNSKLVRYLDRYLNNIGLRYLEVEDLFRFIKKCVIDFRVQRKDIPFIPFKRQTIMFNILRNKFPILKNNDISLLCELIDKSDDKDMIYSALDISRPKKEKLKIESKKSKSGINFMVEKGVSISLKDFIETHFSISESK